MIVEYLTQDGAMSVERLYENPFVDIAPTGPDVLFGKKKATEIENILNGIRASACAA